MKSTETTSSGTVPALPTISALRRLEPRPGGQWAVTGESDDSYSLAYLMDGGNDAICYTIHTCTTEEEVRRHCGSLIYDVNSAKIEMVSTSDTDSRSQHTMTGQKCETELNAYQNDLIDPLIMMSGPRNQHTAAETQPYFGGSQHVMPTIFSSAYDTTDQQIMTNIHGGMSWPVCNDIPPSMSVMMQISDVQNTELAHTEEDAVISGLWDDNFGRIETSLNDNSGQSEWLLPFSSS